MTAYHLIDRINTGLAAASAEALQGGNAYYNGLFYARHALGDDLDARTDLRIARANALLGHTAA